jgi:long-chain acyl-CoA synthetase
MALPPGWPAISLKEAHDILTAPGSRFETETVDIRGIPTKVWKNAPPTNREVFLAARQYGDREFLVYEDDRCTYEAFARATLKLAAQLQADGVKKGDRIAIIMRNLPEWPVAFYAAEIIGAIVTPLNAWWTGPELEYGLVDSGTKIAFVDSERLERIAEHLVNCPALEKIYVSRYGEEMPSPIVFPLEDVIGKVNDWKTLPPGEMPKVDIHPDDDSTILYTSGTTGRPKGALGTHRNMMSNIIAAGFSAARNFLRKGEPIPVVANPLEAPQRSMLLSVPFFHATGCFAVMGPTVVSGGKIVLMRRFDAEKAMALIEK